MKIKKLNQLGFTLVELMIAVAIIAILARIAIPSYKEYVARAKQAEARSELLKAEGWLERYYAENNRYTDSGSTTTNTAFGNSFGSIPKTGTAYYTIALDFPTLTPPVRYRVRATPTGSMASDSCGTYTKTDLALSFSGTGTRCLR